MVRVRSQCLSGNQRFRQHIKFEWPLLGDETELTVVRFGSVADIFLSGSIGFNAKVSKLNFNFGDF
jgi:hypothetical protein